MDGDRDVVFLTDAREKEDGGDPDQLLRQLGGGGDPDFFFSVKPAADAGMDGRKRNGQPENRDQPGAFRMQEDLLGDQVRSADQECGQKKGQGKGNGKTGEERPVRLFRMGGRMPGDGGLDGTGAEGEADSIYGKNHLVDSQALRPNHAGKKDPIKEAENP